MEISTLSGFNIDGLFSQIASDLRNNDREKKLNLERESFLYF